MSEGRARVAAEGAAEHEVARSEPSEHHTNTTLRLWVFFRREAVEIDNR